MKKYTTPDSILNKIINRISIILSDCVSLVDRRISRITMKTHIIDTKSAILNMIGAKEKSNTNSIVAMR